MGFTCRLAIFRLEATVDRRPLVAVTPFAVGAGRPGMVDSIIRFGPQRKAFAGPGADRSVYLK
jgi:hypothetical protein